MIFKIDTLEVKHWIWLASSALFILIVFELAAWLYFDDNQPENSDARLLLEKDKKPFPPSSANEKFDAIVKNNIFGRQTTAPEEQKNQAPETTLQLKLHGIFSGSDDQKGYAIILRKNKSQKNFSVGESVHGLATLQAIYTDRVILLHQGRYETLRLPTENSGLVLQESLVNDSGQNHSNKNKMPTLDEFEYYVTLSPEMDPASEDDSLLGFELRPVNQQGEDWLRRLGLQAGDIIISSNGIALNTEQSYEIIETMLEGGKPVAIIVNRNGSVSSHILE